MDPYTYIWEFQVRPGYETEFERCYGPTGSWVELFRSSPGYIGTILLQDLTQPGRYVTIDRWEDEAAFQSFRRAKAAEFTALDARCEPLTVLERELGRFRVVSPGIEPGPVTP